MTDLDWSSYSLETQAVRAGQRRTHEQEHSDPIFATSSYVFGSAAEAAGGALFGGFEAFFDGDAAVLEYTQRFDRLSADKMDDLELPQARLTAA